MAAPPPPADASSVVPAPAIVAVPAPVAQKPAPAAAPATVRVAAAPPPIVPAPPVAAAPAVVAVPAPAAPKPAPAAAPAPARIAAAPPPLAAAPMRASSRYHDQSRPPPHCRRYLVASAYPDERACQQLPLRCVLRPLCLPLRLRRSARRGYNASTGACRDRHDPLPWPWSRHRIAPCHRRCRLDHAAPRIVRVAIFRQPDTSDPPIHRMRPFAAPSNPGLRRSTFTPAARPRAAKSPIRAA